MKFVEMKNLSEVMFKDIDKAKRRNWSVRDVSNPLWAIRQNMKIITNRYNKLLKEYNKLKEELSK